MVEHFLRQMGRPSGIYSICMRLKNQCDSGPYADRGPNNVLRPKTPMKKIIIRLGGPHKILHPWYILHTSLLIFSSLALIPHPRLRQQLRRRRRLTSGKPPPPSLPLSSLPVPLALFAVGTNSRLGTRTEKNRNVT